MTSRLTGEEIRLRGLLLANDRELLQLHRELVMSGAITEEEFWASRKHKLESHETLLRQTKPPSTSQLLGVDIKPQTDIQGDMKYILTPALIQSIFDQNPIVKKAYTEKVPHVVDEKVFWMQYFTSKFFKESVGNVPAAGQVKSPTTNILDDYYDEFHKVQEEPGLMAPSEGLPISIDIDATLEDHFRAEDPNSRIYDANRPERAKMANIRKLNKLSVGVVETSGINRVDHKEDDDLADLKSVELAFTEELSISLQTIQNGKTAADPAKVMKMQEDLVQFDKTLTLPTTVSYEQYSQIMKDHRPLSISDAPPFTMQSLTVVEPVALQNFTSSMNELLHQFWSAFPPGPSKERQERVSRMSRIIKQMLIKLDAWISAATDVNESNFLSTSTREIRRAAEYAIGKAEPKGPIESTAKRVKI